MKIKILSIGVVKKDNDILFRKKPDGSLPYKETWYIFGGEVGTTEIDPDQALILQVKEQAGITISIIDRIGWDTEIKKDHDGEEKLFIYLDSLCSYVSGELKLGTGIEKLEWVPIDQLSKYDIVPPSVTLFKKMGYL